MFSFNHYYFIISGISSLFSLILLMFLVFKVKKNKLTRTLTFLFLSTFAWMTFSLLSPQIVFDQSLNLILWRLDLWAAFTVAVLISFFSLQLIQKSLKKILTIFTWLLSSFFSGVIIFTPWVVSGVTKIEHNFIDYQQGPYFIIYALVITFILIYSYGYLIKNYLTNSKNDKLHLQLRMVILAVSFPIFLSLITNLLFPILEINAPRLANLSIIPFIYFMFKALVKDNIFNLSFNNFNINVKIAFGFLTSSIIPIIFISLIGFSYIRDYLTKLTINGVTDDIALHQESLRGELDLLKKDLVFLSHVPSVKGIIRALDNKGQDSIGNSSYEQLVLRLQEIFSERIESNDHLMQIRFIDENGNELVRVDHKQGKAVVIPEDSLQNKSDRYYFSDTIKLSENQVYISNLDLNREDSPPQIEVPYKPTIRISTPIFNGKHELKGIVIINILADVLLDDLINDPHPASDSQKTMLVNSQGYYLINPDKNKELGGPNDFDTGVNFLQDYPFLKDEFTNLESGFMVDDQSFYGFSTFEFDLFNDKSEHWFIVKDIPHDDIFAPINTFQNLTIGLVLIFIFLIIIWASIFSRSISKPIGDLMKGVNIISEGNIDYLVAMDSKDEIGDLSRAFDKMTVAIKKSRADIDLKVENQTAEIVKKSQDLEDQQRAVLNILEDVEEEKNRSVAISQDLEKFKLAVENASDHIVITDAEGLVIYANAAVEKITGFSIQEIMGKKAGDKSLWGGLASKEFYEELWDTIKKKKQTFSGEIKNKKKDGQEYISFANISPVLDKNDEVIFFVGIERDVTREKEVDRMKTEFISLASHQLRTPLSAMKWFLEMLLAGDAGKLNKEQTEMIENVDQSNQRMISLVNGLLNISRIESGRIIVEPEPTDLNELVSELLKELEPKIKEKKLTVICSKNEKMGEVSIDPSLILEVYRNLLTNAIKYTPEKGEITILISKNDKTITSQVSDNGMGIPVKDQEKMFEKFHRASNVLKTETDGTGLGLYLTKAIVESSQGEIWFKSKEGDGTTFWFTLPVSGMSAKAGEVRLGEGHLKKTEVKKEAQSDTKEDKRLKKTSLKKGTSQ